VGVGGSKIAAASVGVGVELGSASCGEVVAEFPHELMNRRAKMLIMVATKADFFEVTIDDLLCP
jgi:hypothetical protein